MDQMGFDSIKDPLVREYMQRKMKSQKPIDDAETTSNMIGYGSVLGQATQDFANADRKPLTLQNRFQDLGSAPTMLKPEKVDLDFSGAQNMAQNQVDQARKNQSNDLDSFFTEKNLLAQSTADQATKRMNDPVSDESVKAREFLKFISPQVAKIPNFEKMSAAEIEKISPRLMEYLRMQRENKSMNNYRNDMLKLRQDEKLDQQVQKLSDKLEPSQGLANSLREVESLLGFGLDEYDPVNKTVGGNPVDIAGASVPFIGRFTDYSSESRDLASRIENIFNVELKDRSGAAVTSQELERLRREFSAGKFNTEEELLGALQAYKRAANEAFRNREAGFRPEVVEEYRKRGGRTSESVVTPKVMRADELP